MTTEETGPMLVGRDLEWARMRRLLMTAAEEHSAVLVVRGAAGTGKTALLDHAAKAATGHRVVRVRGVAEETDLPYSALHLLCSSLAEEVTRLEHHQRDALETVVGLRAGPPMDRFHACVAVTELLSLAARTQPLLCIVDDVQWLDPASAYALAFAARRLGPARVALVFADRADSFADLPEVVLDGLSHTDARLLLGSALPAALDEAVLERLVAESRGNPLVLLDSAREAAPAELAGGYGVAAAHEVGDVAAGLALDSRLLLLLAAAEPLGDPARLWRAAARLGIETSAAGQLESANLVSFGTWVTFRHPRMRSSVYGQATAAERRKVHRALALATDPATEPDRHVWHLALALVGPDNVIGDELVRLAATAQRRGGLAAEAAFLERAAACTADPGLRVARAISAAETHYAAGAVDAAVRLLATAEVGSADAVSGARLKRVRARMAVDATRGRVAVAQLLESAQDMEMCEPDLATDAYLEALVAAIFTVDLEVAHTVLTRLACRQQSSTNRLLEGVAKRCTDGYAAAVEPLKLALKALDCDHEEDARSRLLACLVAPDLWDDDTWHELTSAELARAKETGARTILPYLLTHRALVEIHIGRFDVAGSLVAEARSMAEMAATPPFPHADLVLAAWRGQEHPDLAGVGDRGSGMAVAMARYATAVLRNGLGDYRDAVTATAGSAAGAHFPGGRSCPRCCSTADGCPVARTRPRAPPPSVPAAAPAGRAGCRGSLR